MEAILKRGLPFKKCTLDTNRFNCDSLYMAIQHRLINLLFKILCPGSSVLIVLLILFASNQAPQARN